MKEFRIKVKCVICSHNFTTQMAKEPSCPKCFGPVVVVKVEIKS